MFKIKSCCLLIVISFTAFHLSGCGQRSGNVQNQGEKKPLPDQLLLKDYRPHSIYQIPETDVTQAEYSVIDVHSHPYANSSEEIARWVKTMDEVGVRKTIILTKATGAKFDSLYEAYAGRYPVRFIMFCGIDYTGYKKPNWSKKAVKQLRQDYQSGCRGIGELGDKGQGLNYSWPTEAWGMHIDDPRMDPVLEELAKLNMPVSIHVADPKWMYEPMDSTNDGLMNAWSWRRTNKKGIGYNKVIRTLINAVKNHPNVTFIAVHYMNMATNLNKLGKWLDKYPNLYIDISARYAETATIPGTTKRFITKYQNRIMYGTDMGTSRKMYQTTFRILQTNDEHFYNHNLFNYHWPLYGLDLSNQVLKKVYHENAMRILGINL